MYTQKSPTNSRACNFALCASFVAAVGLRSSFWRKGLILRSVRSFFVCGVYLSGWACRPCKMFSHTYSRGTHQREILNDSNTCPWYAGGYNQYTPNADAVAVLQKSITADNELLVFGGTWCGDTQYLLPKFYKVMDAITPVPKTTLVFVDRDKKSGEGIEKQYNIERVPTFIVLKNGVEVGRVVETVENSIEADLAAIFAQ